MLNFIHLSCITLWKIGNWIGILDSLKYDLQTQLHTLSAIKRKKNKTQAKTNKTTNNNKIKKKKKDPQHKTKKTHTLKTGCNWVYQLKYKLHQQKDSFARISSIYFDYSAVLANSLQRRSTPIEFIQVPEYPASLQCQHSLQNSHLEEKHSSHGWQAN